MCRKKGFCQEVILAAILLLSCGKEQQQAETPPAKKPTPAVSHASSTLDLDSRQLPRR